jgi:Arc/MetJ-type ribon-helix-helix transcriptional regulator
MISVRLPNSLEQQLIQFANQTHQSKTDVVRMALSRLFEAEKPTTETEGQRVMRLLAQNGLIGSMTAPADLSVNYKSELDWSHKA